MFKYLKITMNVTKSKMEAVTHIIIKLLKISVKELTKPSGEKHIMYRGLKIRIHTSYQKLYKPANNGMISGKIKNYC